MTKKTSMSIFLISTFTLAILSGCGKPSAESLMNQGLKAELQGQFEEAKRCYAEACSLGRADAYKKMGDIVLSLDFTTLLGKEDSESLFSEMALVLERAGDMYAKAEKAGFSEPLETERAKLQECKNSLDARRSEYARKKALAEQERKKEEERLAEERRKEQLRQEELRRQEMERQAELRRKEEERRAQQERERAEEALRESPQYCIDNGKELSASAFKQIVREMNYRSNTGNKVYDQKVEEEHHAIFRGQRIIVTGKIVQVKGRLLSGIKIKMNVYGNTVWGICKSMSDDEGASLVVGRTIKVEGTVSSAILADINLDNCMPVD